MGPGGPPWLADGAVALDEDDTVRAVGPRAEVRRRYADAQEQRASGALLPGLVNAHTHLELAGLLGAVPGGAGLPAWVASYMRANQALAEDQRREAAARAAADAVRCGTAAI